MLIAGAGIAGLAAARALVAAGHEVAVLEEGDAPRLGTGAVTLWCNGTAILGDLGVGVGALGQRLSALSVRSARGRRVLDVDLDALAARFGSAARVVPRAALVAELLAGLPDGIVRFGSSVADVRIGADRAVVRTASGDEHVADLLVGADGVRSRVRAHVLGDLPAARTGIATWQGLIPAPFDPGTAMTVLVGRRGDCGFMGAGDGLMQCMFELPDEQPGDRPVENLRRRYAGWAEPVDKILAALRDEDIEAFPHQRHRVPRRLGHGRCVLLGDAAHAMPPVLAHGANQALEDVRALAACLAAAPVDAAVRAYSRRRRGRAAAASALAANGLAVTGPRALAQTSPALRLAAPPPALGTWAFGRMLRGLSDRV
ncbi:FAD-dependent oxidoreductase [Actinomadura atramentaria]|uniref:FAD-dependent oxidoreductase n=1 Tax=Actinomadura atramentaria TaxID=1990 RepID=UPI001F0AEB1E|nr:NAD(P)/FAD-dependent oxidoreductase [Actinomadura atramentaria]